MYISVWNNDQARCMYTPISIHDHYILPATFKIDITVL